MKPPQAYVKPETICARWEISRSYLYKLLADERTGLERICVRLPGKRGLRIPERDFEAWMRAQSKKRAKRGKKKR